MPPTPETRTAPPAPPGFGTWTRDAARRHASAERRLAAGFAAGFALLLCMALVFTVQTRRFFSSEHRVAHTLSVIRDIERVLFQVQAAESSQRGYTASGQEAYLPPYQAAAGKLPGEFANLRQAIGDNPAQVERFHEFKAHIDAKLVIMKLRLEQRRTLGLAALEPVYLNGSGRRSMEEIIALGRVMIGEENALLRRREATRDGGLHGAVAVLLVACGVAAALLAAGFLLTLREFRRRHVLGDDLARANEVLENEVAERRRAEARLQASQARFNAFVDDAPAIAFVKDAQGRMLYGNRTLLRRFGLTLEQWLGKTDYDFWPQFADALRERDVLVLASDAAHEIQETVPLPDGTISHWISYKFPLRDEATGEKFLAGMAVDVTARERAEEALRAERAAALKSLREKETLLQEVHHRVKNNLQIIGSLLSMQSRRTTSPAALAALGESAARVRSIALVHEKLYRSADVERIEAGDYLRTLSRNLLEALGSEGLRLGGRVALEFDLETGIRFDASTAIACGLIVNEALTNALKHGFPGQRAGRVTVGLSQAEDGTNLCLEIRDNGAGLPGEHSPSGEGEVKMAQKSLGMRLIHDLTKQIGGRFEMTGGPGEGRGTGVVLRVVFPQRLSASLPAGEPVAAA